MQDNKTTFELLHEWVKALVRELQPLVETEYLSDPELPDPV